MQALLHNQRCPTNNHRQEVPRNTGPQADVDFTILTVFSPIKCSFLFLFLFYSFSRKDKSKLMWEYCNVNIVIFMHDLKDTTELFKQKIQLISYFFYCCYTFLLNVTSKCIILNGFQYIKDLLVEKRVQKAYCFFCLM